MNKKKKAVVNPNRVVRVITKQNLLDLRVFEEQGKYRFNRAPSDDYLASMPDHLVLPVGGAMIHNGVEVRCTVVANEDGGLMFVDMPFSCYYGLQQRSRESGVIVNVLRTPPNVPTMKPRKGVNVVRYLTGDILMRLRERNVVVAEVVQMLGQKTIHVDDPLAEVKADAVIDLSPCALMVRDRAVNSTAWHVSVAGREQVVSITLPVDDYFALPTKEVAWPGWDKEQKAG